jgi:uncharacterized integral membrane protein
VSTSDPRATPPVEATPPDGQAATARATGAGKEPTAARLSRRARRVRLYLFAFLGVGVLAYVAALAGSNTRHVHVNWVFGSSSVALLWLVMFAVILGWLLGLVVAVAFHWRTRAPHS